MNRINIGNLLRSNAYPGRGIILGCSGDGARSIAAYFIMGRSVNSRNRVFEATDDGIRTKAREPAKLTDPSLVIYHPVRVLDRRVIVTNGAQTDTICAFLKAGGDFRKALYEWAFEPDPPIYTSRISGLLNRDGSYSLSILKRVRNDPAEGEPPLTGNGLITGESPINNDSVASCARYFFEYSERLPGAGHFISTYMTDGNPPPSFTGEPVIVDIEYSSGLKGFADAVWDALNEENKVSLYVRETIIATGEAKEIIINKNSEEHYD